MNRSKPNSAARWLSADDFNLWMKTRGLNWGQLGRLLGISAQAARRYSATGLNRTQALAITALEHGLRPWQPSDEDRQMLEQLRADAQAGETPPLKPEQ